ncbi:MAG: hypothetical protein ACPGQS_10535, partial [Bradymonadia bacterium]
ESLQTLGTTTPDLSHSADVYLFNNAVPILGHFELLSKAYNGQSMNDMGSPGNVVEDFFGIKLYLSALSSL